MLNQLIRYGGIGIINTLIHWIIFGILYFYFDLQQSTSNVIAFAIAVTVSYILNSKFTFKARYKMTNYLLYCLVMGGIAFAIGAVSDHIKLNPLFTLILFSLVSFISGFYFSRLIFKRK